MKSHLRCLRSVLIAAAMAATLADCGGSQPVQQTASRGADVPSANRVGHVFLIVLENKDYASTFGNPSPVPYLAQTLVAQGAFLQNYYAIGHVSLDNYIAMVSGQGPNPQTQSDCQFYTDFTGTGPTAVDGQAVGQGCVYPTSVPMLGDQLEAAGLTWREYAEDMGADPNRESSCGVPQVDALKQDPTQTASATDQYAARHNPFVYFHSLVDDARRCAARSVNLDRLPVDLTSVATTPNFAFITPDLCSDGHDSTCADPSRPGGYAGIQAFLSAWVPKILASPAYRQDGLLLITFDESDGPQSDSSACCGEGPTPNSPLPGITGLGGGRVGLVALSPFIAPGTVSTTPYNHYSLLRTIEDLFGLAYLGYAGSSAQAGFGADVFTARLPQRPPRP